MDSPERGTGASTSNIYDLPLPPSALDSLSSIQVSQIQTEIATELYGFAPLTFTSRVVDLANDVIYDVVDKIEEQVSKRWISTAQEEQDQERKDAVAKGVNRLETLLMGAVDIRFDQAETWLIRNTFKVPIELIPYILLPHHPPEGFPQASTSGGARGNDNDDQVLMKQLEEEISKVNGLREEIAILDSVDERMNRRVLALKKMKSSLSELLSAGGTRDTLSAPSKALANAIPSHISQLRALIPSLTSPPSHLSSSSSVDDTSSSSSAQQQPAWKKSREAYLGWITQRVLDDSSSKSGSNVGDAEKGDAGMESLSGKLMQQGSARDIKALNTLINP